MSESGEPFTEHRYALESATALNEGCALIDVDAGTANRGPSH